MEKITINEIGISKALQKWLEEKGYSVHKLEMHLDQAKNEFYATAMVEKEK